MHISIKQLSLLIASLGMLTLSGCGGGGGGGTPSGANGSVAAPPDAVAITPSLGKFSAGTQVHVKKLDGSSLTSGTIGSDGKVLVSLSGYSGPVLVEVQGGAGVTYWDEGSNTVVGFGPGKTMRALLPTPQTEVGVTALTNAAVAKVEAAGGGIAGASVSSINDANAKIAAVFGLPDILVAPNPVDHTKANSLDLAAPGDKYALVLAALAKTATAGRTAVDVSDTLALDLKDNVLNSLSAGTLNAAYLAAANTLATAPSKSVAAMQGLTITSDVSAVTAVSQQSDVSLAKAMLTELRTTFQTFANNNKTGFLDTQVSRAQADLNSNVAPQGQRLQRNVQAFGLSMQAFTDAKAATAGNTLGFVGAINPFTGQPALRRQRNTPITAFFGGAYDDCFTDSTTPAQVNKITCLVAKASTAFKFGSIEYIAIELSATATDNQFSYTARPFSSSVSFNLNSGYTSGPATPVTQDAFGNPMPIGTGTTSQTVSGSTVTGFAINGTLPPSNYEAVCPGNAPCGLKVVTAADTIAVTGTRAALAAANYFRYLVNGTVSSTKLSDASKVVSVALEAGSYFDVDETIAHDFKPVAAKLLITAQTTGNKFVGTLDVGDFMTDADGQNTVATQASFTGTIRDISSGGAGELLTGKLEGSTTGYNLFHSRQPESASNFVRGEFNFVGTVKVPERPLMKLVVAGNRSGNNTGTVLVNYSYGKVNFIGSGSVDNLNSNNNRMTLSNQDGIVMALGSNTGTLTKSGANLATLTHSAINYVDGVTETLN